MVVGPARLLLENQHCSEWRGEPGRVKNAYVKPLGYHEHTFNLG
jgi:hypothetical protein